MVHPTLNKNKNNKNIKNKPKPIFYCFIYTYLHKYLSINMRTKGGCVRGNRRFPGKGGRRGRIPTHRFPYKGRERPREP